MTHAWIRDWASDDLAMLLVIAEAECRSGCGDSALRDAVREELETRKTRGDNED